MLRKKLFIRLGAVSAMIPFISTLVACNTNLKAKTKYNEISSEELFKSSEGKQLIKLIQEDFKAKFIQTVYENYFFNSSSRSFIDNEWKVTNNIPPISKSTNISEMTENLVATNYGKGNIANNVLRDVEHDIWKNELIDPSIKSLLNEIKTKYNRFKQTYPIEQKIVEHDNIKWAQYTFQVDLVSTLERKFMTHYLKLVGEVPLETPSDSVYRKMYNFDSPFVDNKTLNEVLNLLYISNGRDYELPENFWISSKYMNKNIINWNDLQFAKNSNDKYVIAYSERTYDGSINSAGKYSHDGWGTSQKKFSKVFEANSTLEEVARYLEEVIFTKNKNAYISNLFNASDGIKGKIVIASTAGTTIGGLTVEDYVKNFTAACTGFERNLGHFNMMVAGKTNSSLAWVQTGFALGFNSRVVQ